MPRRNNRIRECYVSTMVCPVCKGIQFVERRPHTQRPKYHKKKLWCVNCETERNFTEYSDSIAYKNGLGERVRF